MVRPLATVADSPGNWHDKEIEKKKEENRKKSQKHANALKRLLNERKRRRETPKHSRSGRETAPTLKRPGVSESNVPSKPVSRLAAPALSTSTLKPQSPVKVRCAAKIQDTPVGKPQTHPFFAGLFPAAIAPENKPLKLNGKAEDKGSAKQGLKRKHNGAQESPDRAKKCKLDPTVDGKARCAVAATVPQNKLMISERTERAQRRALQKAAAIEATLQVQKTSPCVGVSNNKNNKRKREDDKVRPNQSPDGSRPNISRPSIDAKKLEHDQVKDDRPLKRARLLEPATHNKSKACSTSKEEPVKETATLAATSADNPRKRPSTGREEDGRKVKRSCSSDLRKTADGEVPKLKEEPNKQTANLAAENIENPRKRPCPDHEGDVRNKVDEGSEENQRKIKRSCSRDLRRTSAGLSANVAKIIPLNKGISESPQGSSSVGKNNEQSPSALGSSAPTSPPTGGNEGQRTKTDQNILKPTGLHNFGNCCFANVVIQMLYRVYLDCGHAMLPSSADENALFGLSAAELKKLKKPVLDRPEFKVLQALRERIQETAGAANEAKASITRSLFTLFESMRQQSGKAVSPAVFQQLFAYVYPEEFIGPVERWEFNGDKQQDPHEFFVELMKDLCNVPCAGVTADSIGASGFGTTFKGVSMSKTTCEACGHVADSEEESHYHQEWALPEGSKTVDIGDFIRQLSKVDSLDDYRCDGCRELGKCKKANVMRKLPDHLMVKVQRATYDRRANAIKKKTNKISLPFGQFELAIGGMKDLYEMLGFLKHQGGTAQEGHYTSFQKYNSSWYKIDDETYNVMKENELLSQLDGQVYMLLFKKVESCNEQTSS